MSTVISDKNFIRMYAAAWVVAYLIVLFFLKDSLPEEYFRDSMTIQKLALPGQDTSQWGGAYGIAAFVARVFPPAALSVWVATLGSCTIWLIVTSIKTMRGMVAVIPVLVPCIILNMMDFGKESFTVPLTYLVVWSATKARSPVHAVLSICVLYVLYGLFFRDYYLIILAAFLGCIMMYRASLPFRIMYVSLVVLALFALPSKLFMTLQGDRDQINYLANMYFQVVHTAITNPLPPNSAFHFIVNYLYAAARLTVPVLFRVSVSDIIMFFNVLYYGRLLYFGLRNKWMGAVFYLPLLYIAHILVLIIFEPDAGSFLRHASSILLYMLPSLRLLESRRAEEILEEEKRKKALSLAATQL